jgi:lipooligosaccharide transport system permease protein
MKIFTIPDLSWRCYRVLIRNLRVWQKYYRASLVGNFGEPLLYLLAFGYGLGAFVKNIDGISYIQFLAPGMLAATAMNGAAYEATFGSYTRMVPQKTYDAIVVTPLSVEDVVAGDILWATMKGLINSMVMLLVMGLLHLIPSWFGLLAISPVILTAFFFASLSMMVTALSPSYEFFSYYFTLIISPMFLLSGIFFPLESLPGVIQKIAYIMPLTQSVHATRALVLGKVDISILISHIYLAIISIPVFLLSLNLTKNRLVR